MSGLAASPFLVTIRAALECRFPFWTRAGGLKSAKALRNGVRQVSPIASFDQFRREIQQLPPQDRQGGEYLERHLVRFYDTYKFILRHYGVPRRMASFGAGSAYVEAALARLHQVQVIVFDFPAALEHHAGLYDLLGFERVAVDLSETEVGPAGGDGVDLALFAEIIEHVPTPPSAQFATNLRRLGACVPLVVTTPNSSSLRHLMKLLFMKPLLPAAEHTFGEVCYENEGYHRREYVPAELRDAFQAVGQHMLALDYSWYHPPMRSAELAIYPLELLVGRFRPCMIAGSAPA
jgi:hypothetical protein